MDTDIRKDNFLKGTISVSFAVILTKIMGVLYKVPLSYLLGDEGMGYFNSAYAIYSFFYILCTSGVPKAITLSIMKYRDMDIGASHSVVKFGISLFAKVGLIITAFCLIFAPAIVNIIGSKNSLYTIIAISPAIIFVSVSGVLRGCLNTYNKLTDIAVSQLIESFIKLLLGLVLAFVGYRLRLHLSLISALCILGITIGSIISTLYLAISYKHIFKGEKIRQRVDLDSKNVRRDIFKVAVPISFGAAVLNFGGIIDLGVIMHRLSRAGFSAEECNAIYGNYTTLAVPMFNLVVSLISPLMLAFLPHLVDALNHKDSYRFEQTLSKMLTVNNMIAFPAFFAFCFYSFDLLDILFSSSSSAIAAELLQMLSVGLIFISLLTVINTALEAKGKVVITVVSLVTGGIVKAIGNYILIDRTGILGAPLSTVASYAVSLLISLVALRSCGVRMRILKRCVPELLAGFVFFGLPYTFIYSRGQISVVSVFLCLAISSIAYFGMVFVRSILTFKNVNNAQKLKCNIGYTYEIDK